MSNRWARWLVLLNCLALGTAGVSSRAAAADSSKSWPSKKKKKHHRTHHKASTSASTKAKTGAPPADEGDDEGGDESAQDDEQDEAPKAKPKSTSGSTTAKSSKTTKSSDDEREAADEKDEKDEGERDEGDDAVIHRKARATASAGGAPVALELSAGPRAVHRTFDFNDPLSNYQPTRAKPYSYVLPAGPAPFVDVGLYPAAFATRGFLANIGVVASYERLLATTTQAATSSTLAQQYTVGLRGRIPFGDQEAGLGVSYGKQTFHVSDTDPGPSGGTVPNVDYTFIGVGADARFRLSALTLGAHVGTRLVRDTGSLGQVWFTTVKTTSIEGGLSAGYRLTPMFEVVAGADFLRYAFDFNPVSNMNALIAGGAVDQYISGYLALRVSITGG